MSTPQSTPRGATPATSGAPGQPRARPRADARHADGTAPSGTGSAAVPCRRRGAADDARPDHCLGAYAEVVRPGRVAVGDPVASPELQVLRSLGCIAGETARRRRLDSIAGSALHATKGAPRVRPPHPRRRQRAPGRRRHDGRGRPRRRPVGGRRAGRRRAARPGLRARRRRRGRAGRDRLRRRPGDPAALDRARDGPGRAGALSRTPSSASARRSRTASTTTSTSRRRSPPTTSAHREADAADRQGGADVLPPRGQRRRGARRARRRAVQARADRPQGRRRRGRGRGRRRRGRRRRADHLRQPAQGRLAGLEGPLPRAAPADAPGTSRRSS